MSRFCKAAMMRGSSEQTHLLAVDRPDLYGTCNTDVANSFSQPSTPVLLPVPCSNGSDISTLAGRFPSRTNSWTKLPGSAIKILSEPQESSQLNYDISDEVTSVDWLYNAKPPSTPGKYPRKTQGIFNSASSKLQDWAPVGLIGIFVACIAFLITAVEPVIFDLRFGYCSTSVFASRQICCHGQSSCNEWRTWAQSITDVRTIFLAKARNGVLLNMTFYTITTVLVALTSCALVLLDGRVIQFQDDSSFGASPTKLKSKKDDGSKNPQTIIYTCAGSGAAELKVIASGFMIKHFLGARTLFVKTIACILSVGSGLSVGKEGPLVHIAACVGYNVSRSFPDYKTNANKRRAVISASSAAGLAVAFGTPITGVLFSLEEVFYHFSPKSLFQTFFCATTAILTLRFLNPYANDSFIVPEIRDLRQWKILEVGVFVILGMLGGATGAFMIKGIRLWATTFRNIRVIKKWPLLETLIIALITAATSYWNSFASLPQMELISGLASNCDNLAGSENGLCPGGEKIPRLIWSLLVGFIIKGSLTVVSNGLKVPAGIYMPSMAVGGLLGRAAGHAVQYMIAKYGHDGMPSTCALTYHTEGCVAPGVYALVVAGATLCGVTRLSLTPAVMLFELTGSLEHVPIFSIAIMVSKWTANFIEPRSIYESYLDRSDFPYLDKDHPGLSGRLGDITTPHLWGRTIDITLSPKISSNKLRDQLKFLLRSGQFDGGLPILDCNVLIGFISCQDLAYCLDRIPEDKDVPCLVSPRMVEEQGLEEDEEGRATGPTDFTPFIDPAPFSLDVQASTDFVYECFSSMGVAYVCVLRDGRFVGLLRKKAFAKYVRQLRRSCRPFK